MEKNIMTTGDGNNWMQAQEVQLVYKSKIPASQRPQICNSRQSADLLRAVWNMDEMELREAFKMLLLNGSNRVMGVYHGFFGGVSSTIADVRLLLTVALKANVHRIVISHNHPGGNIKPSDADVRLTNKVKDTASFFDIELLDHIILTSEAYLSFADEGLL